MRIDDQTDLVVKTGPLAIISQYFEPDSRSYGIVTAHGRQVAEKAVGIARNMPAESLDLVLISEAAMLHDIGIFMTHTPTLDCSGKYPYICHGYLGRKLLEKHGIHKHALVCERHVGVGISKDEIRQLNLPLPEREMIPVTMEEKIICYADKFFSKSGSASSREKSVDEVIATLERYGRDKVERFMEWHECFKT
ncbi:MAG: phosphohydrolase [Desulfobacteraceae bacterium]|nr:phosphohydrolase [Desulfobacteraceae bacterium]